MIDHHPHVVPNLYDIFPHKEDILKTVSVFAYNESQWNPKTLERESHRSLE